MVPHTTELTFHCQWNSKPETLCLLQRTSTNSHKTHNMSVMPMEIFVSCVEDLVTLGRVRVGLDLGLFSPWFVSFSFFFVPDALGSGKFHFGSPLAIWPSRVSELWRQKQDAQGDTGCLDKYSAAA